MDKREMFDNLLLGLGLFAIMFLVMFLGCGRHDIYNVYADNESTATSTDAVKDSSLDSTDSSQTSTTEAATTTTADTSGATTTVNAADLSALTEEYTKTLQSKNQLQTKINNVLSTQNDFISVLRELDDMILEYQDKIDELNKAIEDADKTKLALAKEVEDAQAKQDAQYEIVKRHIKEEYENGNYSYMDALFNAVDYMDIVNKAEYIQAISKYDNNLLNDYTLTKKSVADKIAVLTVVGDNLSIVEETYKLEQESIELISEEKEKQINAFQTSLDDMNSQMKTIEALEADQTAKLAAAEAAYNVNITVGGNSSTGTAVWNGEQFLWPMPSSSVITSYYGDRTAPTAGATTNHQGIDIQCNMGSPVIAVAPGTVIYIGYLGNAGNAVMVDHGGGISTCYFHLSKFACSVGDSVTAGQTICFSGCTGVATGPHLHFAVRENGKYVNPLKYYKTIPDKGNGSSSNTTTTDNSSSNTAAENNGSSNTQTTTDNNSSNTQTATDNSGSNSQTATDNSGSNSQTATTDNSNSGSSASSSDNSAESSTADNGTGENSSSGDSSSGGDSTMESGSE